MKNGEGIYFYSNGSRYEGNYLNDKKNGHGSLFYSNGDRYEGNF